MVVFKVLLYGGIASYSFDVISTQDRDVFTAGIVCKLIKGKMQLAKGIKCILRNDRDHKFDDLDTLYEEIDCGTILDLELKNYKRSDSKEKQYPGEVLVDGSFGGVPATVFYSPMLPTGFIKQKYSAKAGNNPTVPTVLPDDDASMPYYDLAYGCDYLQAHVQAYCIEGGRVWMWMSDGQVNSYEQLPNPFDQTKDAVRKALEAFYEELDDVYDQVDDLRKKLKKSEIREKDLVHENMRLEKRLGSNNSTNSGSYYPMHSRSPATISRTSSRSPSSRTKWTKRYSRSPIRSRDSRSPTPKATILSSRNKKAFSEKKNESRT